MTSPLVWDNQLAAESQQWANHLADMGALAHAKGVGENLYKSQSWGTPPKDSNSAKALLSWYVIIDYSISNKFMNILYSFI